MRIRSETSMSFDMVLGQELAALLPKAPASIPGHMTFPEDALRECLYRRLDFVKAPMKSEHDVIHHMPVSLPSVRTLESCRDSFRCDFI